MKLEGRDNIALIGGIVGLAACFMGWLILKPNRLATGISLNLGDSFGWGWGSVLVGLWIICVAASFLKKNKTRAILIGIIANIVLVLTIALAGFFALRILGNSSGLERVALSGGVYLTLIAIYIVIFAAYRSLKETLTLRLILTWSGVVIAIALVASGKLDQISVVQEFIAQKERFFQELQQHVLLFSWSIAAGIIIGVPLGIWAFQSRKVEKPIFFLANITQTIPSLALFGLLIAPLSLLSQTFPVLQNIGIRGIGTTPALIALVIYSLLPIIQNTYAGLRELNPAMIDAGKGMGMGRFLIFWKIELPLSAPLILEGVRTSAVQTVGNTAVAALIGAGGLGQLIFQGLGQAASDLIILGSIPIIVLALLIDSIMRVLVKAGTPAGAR